MSKENKVLTRLRSDRRLQWIVVACLAIAVIIMFFVSLSVGSSHMSVVEAAKALFGKGTNAAVRIMQRIRLPRIIAALVAGAGLSVAGLIMQTCLNNVMASPSTLGVSNAAVFGANLALIGLAGGYLTLGTNATSVSNSFNPFAVSSIAFVFAMGSVLLILALSKIRAFSPNTVVLAGVAVGAIWTAATTLLQYHATDIGLSAGVIWSFGDLGRATFTQDYIMLAVVGACSITFFALSWRFNALLSGDAAAHTVGVNVPLLRFIGMLLSSLITAVCVSFLGIIGFVGIICPHVMKKILGSNHVVTIPASILAGSLLLLVTDTISRTVGNGTALPVGAITSLIGAPFFLIMLFAKKERV